MRPLLSLALLAIPFMPACGRRDDAPAPAPDPCAILFGNPSDQTGLGLDRCRPQCACGATVFSPPAYDAVFIQSLVDGWQLATPYAPLSSDPYAAPPPADDAPGTVCAVVPHGDPAQRPRPYDLVTFASGDVARAAGAEVTHFGHCGVCSTLANLAVYMAENDLVAPVRSCGVASSSDGGNADVACLQQLGFDLPCAQAWAYDTAHTRDVCLSVCIANLRDPYNLDDGGLNPCIQCDEDQSGPVFKAVAGRTRRNSGLPNAICRPCSEVQALVHAY
ncbi:MAG TPA: hypothetical protein VIF15_01430 [Polyangiaceae bacterium]|jgi:hypothetical protein